MSTVRKLYKPVKCLRINPILKCKHSFENQEAGRYLETASQITTRGTVSKAISIFCKLSHLGGNEPHFMIFPIINSLSKLNMVLNPCQLS